jgi:hypothetical protein
VVYLPKEDLQKEAAKKLDQTIQNHFRYKTAQTKREMKETFASGRISLAIGISFLALTRYPVAIHIPVEIITGCN